MLVVTDRMHGVVWQLAVSEAQCLSPHQCATPYPTVWEDISGPLVHKLTGT